jgi:hypothetical protein
MEVDLLFFATASGDVCFRFGIIAWYEGMRLPMLDPDACSVVDQSRAKASEET